MSSLFRQTDDIFFFRHPELVDPDTGQRRLLTRAPDDRHLRQEWMVIYRELERAENEGYEVCELNGSLQRCPISGSGENPEKLVSEKAMLRLHAAQEAINYSKEILSFGAGNQRDALETTQFNSNYRLRAARYNHFFNIPQEVVDLAEKNQEAFIAAKAELTQGGNCGEHAYVVYDYLRRKFPDEHIQISQKDGLDHAFVIIGDPSTDSDQELVVADSWPTDPTPVLWEDHFAYTSDKKKLLKKAESKGDSRNYKQEMIDAGLSLKEDALKFIEQSLDKEETNKQVNDGLGKWIWEHSDSAETKYDYISNSHSSFSRPSE